MSDRCGICDGDPGRRRAVDQRLAEGKSGNAIERELKALGITVKRETVLRHAANCLGAGTKPPEIVTLAAAASASGSNDDFAALVRAEAVRRLNAGDLKVGVSDGLQAQALLDRRDEKKKDRELVVTIGRLLAGGGNQVPLTIIDMTGEEIEEAEPLLVGPGA